MKKNIKKEITFFCTDKVERQCCDSIIKEAELRGYKVRVTDNKFEKAEIFIYHIGIFQNIVNCLLLCCMIWGSNMENGL